MILNNYFVRRFLLIIPTFLGVTLVVFFVTRFVPGGPVEQAITRYLMAAQGDSKMGGASRDAGKMQNVSPETIAQLNAFYGFDKPWYVSYIEWLSKVLRGDLGMSTRYTQPVLGMIVSKFPVSLRFGVVSLILTYVISIPLGIKKALKHRSLFDNVSSIVVFIGYALPTYIVALLLLQLFAFQLHWFPSGGLYSRNYASLNFFQKIGDSIYHMILPLIAYMIGDFAGTTIGMKNYLMDNMASDYVKTAVAKGNTFKDTMWKHALKNSIVPIAAGFGTILGVFFAGSFLIEQIFNINGMGMLGYKAIVERDYPVVMGHLVFTSLISLTGHIFSDMILSALDPRIRLGE